MASKEVQNDSCEKNVCDFCSKTFSSRKYVRNHICQCHREKIESTCDICNQTFKSKEGLAKHVKVYHENPEKYLKSFNCNFCEKTLSSERNLKDHFYAFHNND